MRPQVIAVLGLVLYLNHVIADLNYDQKKVLEWLQHNHMKHGNNSCSDNPQEESICVEASLCNKNTDPSTGFTYRSKTDCLSTEICCPRSQVRSTDTSGLTYDSRGCGFANPGAANENRMKDNEYGYADNKYGYAEFAEFQWMIAMFRAGTNSKVWEKENYIGGGTLIHPSVVMTVAHKVMDMKPNELACRAGEWDTRNEEELHPHQDRLVREIILHEEFVYSHARNDIALLIMQEPFTLAPNIDVACLSPLLPPVNTECYSMGWGQDFPNSNINSDILKKIKLPLMDSNTCQARYKNSRLGSGYTLHRSLTCAGGEANVDTCIGDGGSSLVCPIGDSREERYQVVGSVVYGLECGTKNLPGVYADVSYLYTWIDDKMSQHGFDKSSYVF